MCGCGNKVQPDLIKRSHSKEISQILNRWIIDNMNRKLLIQDPIYDVYNDIIGYITKEERGNVIRIFAKNIKEILPD